MSNCHGLSTLKTLWLTFPKIVLQIALFGLKYYSGLNFIVNHSSVFPTTIWQFDQDVQVQLATILAKTNETSSLINNLIYSSPLPSPNVD
jgi:hypothetical protein